MLYLFSIKFFRPAFRFDLNPEDVEVGEEPFIDYSARYDSTHIYVESGRGLRLADELMKVVRESYNLKSESDPNGWVITKISYDCLGDDGGGRVVGDSGRGTRAIANLRKRFPLAFNAK